MRRADPHPVSMGAAGGRMQRGHCRGLVHRAQFAAALAGAICVLAGGCAHLRSAEDGLSYEERRTRLLETPGWRMNGRIAVNTGAQAFQGRFRWRQSEEEVELSINNPLGMNVLQVSGPPERLTVRAGGETWELADPEPELSAILGWWLPVRSFNAWLLGYADPDFGANQQFSPPVPNSDTGSAPVAPYLRKLSASRRVSAAEAHRSRTRCAGIARNR